MEDLTSIPILRVLSINSTSIVSADGNTYSIFPADKVGLSPIAWGLLAINSLNLLWCSPLMALLFYLRNQL